MRITLLAVTIFILLFPLSQAFGQESSFHYRWSIGTPIGIPQDVAMDRAGNILILQNDHITKTRVDGHFLEKIDIKKNRERLSTFSMVLDSEDNIYVADALYRNVIKYTPSGDPIFVVGMADNGATSQTYVGRLAIDAADNLYVSNYEKKRIDKFDPQGRFIQSIGSGIDVGGELNHIMKIGVDGQGNLYVLSSDGYSATPFVHKYSPTGEYLIKFNVKQEGPSYNPNDIASMAVRKDGGFYTVHDFYRQILHYDANGVLVNTFAGHGGGVDGNLNGRGITLAIDREGNVYACDNHLELATVNKYTPDGQYVRKYGREYQFYTPIYDRWNNVYALSGSFSKDDIEIHKYSASTELVLRFKPTQEAGFSSNPSFMIIAVDEEENIYYLHQGSDKQQIQKYSKNGQLVRKLNLSLTHENTTSGSVKAMTVDSNGIIHLAKTTTDLGGVYVTSLNQQGDIIGQPTRLGNGKVKFASLSHIAFDDMGFVYTQDFKGNRIRKFSPYGDLLLAYGDTSLNKSYNYSYFSVDNGGNAYWSIYTNYQSDKGIKIHKHNGELREELNVQNRGIGVNKSGTEFATLLFNGTIALYTSKESVSQSYITGKVFTPIGNACEAEVSQGLAGIVVSAEPGPYFGISDASGNYTLAVEPGDYAVRQLAANRPGISVEEICSSATSVSANQAGLVFKGPNFGNSVTLSPHLSVSVSSTRRRRCFDSTTKVRYSNMGFATAPDAKVYLQLPAEVELLSADKPHTRLADGTYVFSVGDLAAGQSGTITIEDLVTCGDESVRGLTVCTRAWITPSNNTPSGPIPTISISGRCDAQSGMIRFVVRNTGTADMLAPGHYRKYADGELASVEQYRLAAGDSMVFWVPSLGYTWRIEADQPDGNGDNTVVSLTIEGCTDGTTVPSTGLVNLLPTDDEEAEKSAECMLITDSYDPNDKLVTPVGLTKERYTPTNTALKYKIRFQNTGTDVAYRVVVVDTLSEHLDLRTLQVGATSHPGRFEVSGKGLPVLTWTFDNIMLPDSTTDEPGSHGYIQFSIKPKADLPEKTLVENSADIFFDFNSPIRTNVTQNRIYDMPPVISEAVRINPEDVLATPAITEFSPAAGRYGAEITITGKRFAANAPDNQVYLNGKAAMVINSTATELKVLVPAGATTGSLKVITPDGGVSASATFQVYQPPVLTSFSPAEGVVGRTVTLTGEHLQAELIEGIKLGGLDCEILNFSGNTLTLRVPAGASTGTFEVSTKGGEAVSTSSFVVWHQPMIHAISAESAIVGAAITVSGENFAADKARNTVHFGSAKAQILGATDTRLVVQVPVNAASGQISLETPGGIAWSAAAIAVIPGPMFTGMHPAKGAVGTVVEITGAHFGIMGQQDVIRFNGEPALVLESAEDRYKVRVPRGATTGKVTITGYGGEARSTASFVVEELAPAEAIQVYPNPNNGRFMVSLRHADFDVQSIEVYDAVGKRHHQTRITGPRPETVEIHLPSATSGMYFLQIQTDRGLITKKLTVL
jgi:hypothetical protein